MRAQVAGSAIGATLLFVGSVRDQARGKEVQRLEYEAYNPMAERQLERILGDVEREVGEVQLSVVHRHGVLQVGDIAVVIAASSPHRAEAFEACRAVIERIKVDVPIWKKEISSDGDEWVGWGGG